MKYVVHHAGVGFLGRGCVMSAPPGLTGRVMTDEIRIVAYAIDAHVFEKADDARKVAAHANARESHARWRVVSTEHAKELEP